VRKKRRREITFYVSSLKACKGSRIEVIVLRHGKLFSDEVGGEFRESLHTAVPVLRWQENVQQSIPGFCTFDCQNNSDCI